MAERTPPLGEPGNPADALRQGDPGYPDFTLEDKHFAKAMRGVIDNGGSGATVSLIWTAQPALALPMLRLLGAVRCAHICGFAI